MNFLTNILFYLKDTTIKRPMKRRQTTTTTHINIIHQDRRHHHPHRRLRPQRWYEAKKNG